MWRMARLSRFGLDGNRLRRANRFAQLARDATLFTIGITAQRMLAAETRANGVLFERIVDRRLGLEEILQGQPMRLDEFPQREAFDEVGDAHLIIFPLPRAWKFELQ